MIAWWQIGCGVLGIATSAAAYFDLVPNGRVWIEQTAGWINYYAGVAFFSFTIAAGRALLKGATWGLRASCACQLLQVVSFAFLHGPTIWIQAGPLLGVDISASSVTLSAGFYSTFFVGTRVAGPAFDITVNVLAGTWATLLLKELVRRRRDVVAAA